MGAETHFFPGGQQVRVECAADIGGPVLQNTIEIVRSAREVLLARQFQVEFDVGARKN